ncbi:hypothetical protein FA15DRAFT_648605 [Coprinopsis marcescibilis]|uniref:CHAT domain-containing protein n=1 Tax=Coprinopsis marcescibilis TaxID=230819 RepID=A0A5C3KGW6_COPMA|nr:hypothetical protein FA15DRAFT_648605 [Coprinopsis marcescibilis]
MPSGNVDFPSCLSNLGISLRCRYEQTAELSDISEAIALQRKAAELVPPDHAHLCTRLNQLGISLTHLFKRTGEPSDIAEAIAAHQKSVKLTPSGHADLPTNLSNLGNSLLSSFEKTGDLSELADAITAHQRAVDLTPPGHAELPGWLNNLGLSILSRSKQTGKLSDITEAIATLQRAVSLSPPGDFCLFAYLDNLGMTFLHRFERTEDLSDSVEAIDAYQRAVDLTPPGHADLPSRLNSLGIAWRTRFEQSGNLSDIAEAIALQQKARAVDLTPPDHADLPTLLSNLGGSFLCRFKRLGEWSDLTEAVAAQQRALDLTPQGRADLPSKLNNLGLTLRCRFERTREASDIAEAITTLQRAVELTPSGHADLPTHLSNLGSSLFSGYEQTDELSELEEAISTHQRAVDLTPLGDADLPFRLSNLGFSSRRRFQRTGNLSEIAEAIEAHQSAIDITPPGHAGLSTHYSSLGNSLWHRFSKTSSPDDLNQAIAHFKLAANCAIGPPSDKFDAARLWALLLYIHFPASPDILIAFETAVRLVSVLAGMEMTVQHRHTMLRNISAFSLQAAGAACSFRRPDKAIEWLELGRCLVWHQLKDLRTPLDDLRACNPALAQRVSEISGALENASSRTGRSRTGTPASASEETSAEEEARSHVLLAQEWDTVLDIVRSTPDFADFLQTQPYSKLLPYLPASGHIVVINIDEDRCDALVLIAGRDEPLHIALPDFSLERAEKLRKSMTAYLGSSGLRTEAVIEQDEERGIVLDGSRQGKVLRNVLATLWKKVVKPILEALEFSSEGEDVEELPRIWWCPTGPLAFLPLHAAGIYEDRDSDTIFDYAVSSYTPTVASLTDRIKNTRVMAHETSGLFMVSQPNTPHLPSIPATTDEVQAIQAQLMSCGVRELMLEGKAATVELGLEGMENYTSVHFACHATQDRDKPLQSGFHFHDGRLSLSTIIKKDLKNGDLAFLSACQTSTGEETLSEEAVHLAAGMLAAGYRGVVATMWSIGDKYGPEVASNFYKYLLDRGGPGIDGSGASYALHHAIGKLRRRLDNSERSLRTWVPYVHFGL